MLFFWNREFLEKTVKPTTQSKYNEERRKRWTGLCMSREMPERTEYTGHRSVLSSSLWSQFKKTHCSSRVGWQPPATAPLNPPWLFIPKPHFYALLPLTERRELSINLSHACWCGLFQWVAFAWGLPSPLQNGYGILCSSHPILLLSWCPFIGLGLNCCLRLSLPTLAPPPLFLYSSQTFPNKPCHL